MYKERKKKREKQRRIWGEGSLGHRREEEEERKNIKRREGIKNGKIRQRNRKIMKSRLGGIEPDSKGKKRIKRGKKEKEKAKQNTQND